MYALVLEPFIFLQYDYEVLKYVGFDEGDGWCNTYKFGSLDEAWSGSWSMHYGHEGKQESLIMIIGEVESHDEDEEGHV